jgi:elongation factor G
MKEYGTGSIRNVALVGHGSSGKTSLAEALLNNTGATTRIGKIEDGTTASDFDEEEIRRKISIYTSVIPCEYQNHKINLLDTPGFTDFVGEVKSALRVAEAVMVLVDAVSGVEVGTELVWQYADERSLPRFVVINKMNRENANFQQTLESLRAAFKAKFIPVQLPWGEKDHFQGVVDLLSLKAFKGAGAENSDIPADLRESAEEARVALIEAAAEADDTLLEKYLGGEELTPEEIESGFRRVVGAGQYIPVYVAAATANVGITPLLDAILHFFPSPADAAPEVLQGKNGEESLPVSDSGPLGVFVFKTTADPFVGRLTFLKVKSGVLNSDTRVWNQSKSHEERIGSAHVSRGKEQIAMKVLHAGDIGTVAKLAVTVTGDTLCDRGHPLTYAAATYPSPLYSVAVLPKTQGDSAKMGPTLSRLCEEDPTLQWHQEASTKQAILAGMGDQHIDVAIRRAETRFGTGIATETPRVPYRETITRAHSDMHRHKKQTGGAGQFGEVHMRVEPNPESDYEFVDEVVGMALSHSYMPSIEKGIKSVMEHGAIAGYPVVNVRVAVFDGKEHPVDSKPIAFEIAGREAFKKCVKAAGPVLQEPIMKMRIVVPEANMGDVLGDLNTRRARVQGMEQETGKSIVTAEVPMSEILRYATDLRSITGGRGVYSMQFERYDVVPNHIAQNIIAAAAKAKAGEAEDEE